ncbi:MAG: septum formation family protein [Actinomycetota bacterium]
MEGRTASPDLVPLEFDVSAFGPVGTCMAPGTTMRVSCDSDHDSEVFGTIPLQAESYPGDLTLTAAVNEACAQHFARLRDRDGVPDGYFPINWQPSELAWERGSREAVCTLAFRDGASTRGSVLAGTAAPSPGEGDD